MIHDPLALVGIAVLTPVAVWLGFTGFRMTLTHPAAAPTPADDTTPSHPQGRLTP